MLHRQQTMQTTLSMVHRAIQFWKLPMGYYMWEPKFDARQQTMPEF